MSQVTVEQRKKLIGALSREELEALKDLKESNALTEDDLLAHPERIQELAMFMFNFPKIYCMQLFPFLRHLQLMQQGLKVIEGLESLKQLEALWLNDNCLEKIEGLEHCTMLQRLYLWNNKIRRIQGLAHLHKLEVLWLAGNDILVVEGLENCTALRELHLAGNPIEQLGGSLLHCTNIESLNLARTQIGSFREVAGLARLPHLRDLCFSDPHWGDSPVALLSNYQTYCLFCLPYVTALDTQAVSEQTRQVAEATFLKKRMYYNMRLKTLRRNLGRLMAAARDGILSATSSVRKSMKSIEEAIAAITRAHIELEEGVGAAATPAAVASGPPRPTAGELDARRRALEAALDAKRALLAGEEARLEAAQAQAWAVHTEMSRRILLELESGGNVRLEEGQPSDLWHTSCVDLVASRFHAGAYAPLALGIEGVRVMRVVRVHNRHLRHRFDRLMEQAGAAAGAGGDGGGAAAAGRQAVEYLFLGEDLHLPGGSLSQVAEEGLPHPSEWAARGIDREPSFRLSNSVGLCDGPRVSMARSRAQSDPQAVLRGQLLVVKACVGRATHDDAEPLDALFSKRPSGRSTKQAFPGSDSVSRAVAGDPKQKSWWLFNHAALLPEYLVDFEYVSTALTSPSVALSAQDRECLARLGPDLVPMAHVMLDLLPTALLPHRAARKVHDPDAANPAVAVGAGPGVGPFPAVMRVTDAALEKALDCPERRLATLTALSLAGSHVARVASLTCFRALKVLRLPFNGLTRIEGLEKLVELQTLDLCHNKISRIEGLKGLENLRELLLAHNQITALDDLNLLRKYTPRLTVLDMRGNPIYGAKSYAALVLRRLPLLKTHDGHAVTRAAADAASEKLVSLTPQMIKASSYTSRRSVWAAGAAGGPGSVADREDDGWWEEVEEIVVDAAHVRRLQNLGRLSGVLRASFRDNEIARIEGLEGCTSLQELSLEDNCISDAAGLAGLTQLRKLDLGQNMVASLAGLTTLTNLTQLSVEENRITSLAGLSSLVSLMELYAANNRLEHPREALHAKDLPHLIILDLVGNPLTRAPSYRHYVIFQARRLKVLDGAPVEAQEQAAAKSRFAGRLTRDFLRERLGHGHFDRIRELDISGLKIRDTGAVFRGESFQGLTSLTMAANLLTSVAPFSGLRGLRHLRLPDNRLAEASFSEPPAPLDPELPDVDPDDMPSSFTESERIMFPSLELLDLGSNSIAALPPLDLGQLRTLRVLHLSNNGIARIEGLTTLVRLEELVLDYNRIKQIDPGALKLPALRVLSLESNMIRSLQAVTDAPALVALNLGHNRVLEATELDHLCGFTSLLELNLLSNPVARRPSHRVTLLMIAPALRIIDRRQVDPEEKEAAEAMLVQQEMQQQQMLAAQMAAAEAGATGTGSGRTSAALGAGSGASRIQLRVNSLSLDPGGQGVYFQPTGEAAVAALAAATSNRGAGQGLSVMGLAAAPPAGDSAGLGVDGRSFGIGLEGMPKVRSNSGAALAREGSRGGRAQR
ncbi:unnamed protein product [Pedinophyceae sp. YPF-701]|nr:unnamed protein product [Pedinophyceae sp. YPF-701]